MPAVSPGESVRPGKRFAVVQKITVDIPRLKISQRSSHDDIRQTRSQRVGRRHAYGSGKRQAGKRGVGTIDRESHARFVSDIRCQYRTKLRAGDQVRIVLYHRKARSGGSLGGAQKRGTEGPVRVSCGVVEAAGERV